MPDPLDPWQQEAEQFVKSVRALAVHTPQGYVFHLDFNWKLVEQNLSIVISTTLRRVRAETVEDCAKKVENAAHGFDTTCEESHPAGTCLEVIANAIRALAHQGKDNAPR